MNRQTSAFLGAALLLSVSGCAGLTGDANQPGLPVTTAGAAPRALSGNTLLVAGDQVRLWGITTPRQDTELGQLAAEALQTLVGDHAIACVTQDRSIKVVTAICTLPDGSDIGAELVRQGWASADPPPTVATTRPRLRPARPPG